MHNQTLSKLFKTIDSKLEIAIKRISCTKRVFLGLLVSIILSLTIILRFQDMLPYSASIGIDVYVINYYGGLV
jgi:hypothetical protein